MMSLLILIPFQKPEILSLEISDIDWYSHTHGILFTQDFCDLLFENNFSQLVTSPTHIHGNLLDLVPFLT